MCNSWNKKLKHKVDKIYYVYLHIIFAQEQTKSLWLFTWYMHCICIKILECKQCKFILLLLYVCRYIYNVKNKFRWKITRIKAIATTKYVVFQITIYRNNRNKIKIVLKMYVGKGTRLCGLNSIYYYFYCFTVFH